MPKDASLLSLPFLTRDMLAFEQGITFTLDLTVVTSGSYTLIIRGFTKEGAFKFDQDLPNITATTNLLFGLPDLPLGLSITADVSSGPPGGCYVAAFLQINGDRYLTLCQGNVANAYGINYPQQLEPTPLQMTGGLVTVTGADPAAGAEASVTLNSLVKHRIIGYKVTFVAAATAFSRRPHLLIDNGASDIFLIPAAADITSGQTAILTWGVGLANVSDATGLTQTMPLPAGLILPGNSGLATLTTNLQAGDDYGAPVIVTERLAGI